MSKQSKHYRITFASKKTGVDKFVLFHDGVGVLDEDVVRYFQPEWFRSTADGHEQISGARLDAYVEFWSKTKNANVEEIKGLVAKKLKEKIAKNYAAQQEAERIIEHRKGKGENIEDIKTLAEAGVVDDPKATAPAGNVVPLPHELNPDETSAADGSGEDVDDGGDGDSAAATSDSEEAKS